MPAEVKACPCCGEVRFKETGAEAPGFRCTVGGCEFEQPPYCIYECPKCALLYKTRTASPAELHAYYGVADFRRWEIPGYFPTERAALAVLRSLPHRARLLDFGCSSGRLMAPLLGDYECHGLEVNGEAAKAAAAKGLRILTWDGLGDCGPQQFDAVILVDVFEHLTSPLDLLRKLYALLKPQGLLLIVTGNGDYAPCRLDPAQFWYFRNVEHLCMLTRRHAGYLAACLGGPLERWEELSHYDASLCLRLKRYSQHIAFWQFRRRTIFARTILPLIPKVRQAQSWPVAPAFEVGRDHVLSLVRKP